MTSPMRGADLYDGSAFQNKVNYLNASSHSYNPTSYDPVSLISHLSCSASLESLSGLILLSVKLNKEQQTKEFNNE